MPDCGAGWPVTTCAIVSPSNKGRWRRACFVGCPASAAVSMLGPLDAHSPCQVGDCVVSHHPRVAGWSSVHSGSPTKGEVRQMAADKTQQVMVRLSPDLHQQLKTKADNEE